MSANCDWAKTADGSSIRSSLPVAVRKEGPSRDNLADEIAAFTNANGGVLLCGVSDDGETQSMPREQLVELDTLLVDVASDSSNLLSALKRITRNYMPANAFFRS